MPLSLLTVLVCLRPTVVKNNYPRETCYQKHLITPLPKKKLAILTCTTSTTLLQLKVWFITLSCAAVIVPIVLTIAQFDEFLHHEECIYRLKHLSVGWSTKVRTGSNSTLRANPLGEYHQQRAAEVITVTTCPPNQWLWSFAFLVWWLEHMKHITEVGSTLK